MQIQIFLNFQANNNNIIYYIYSKNVCFINTILSSAFIASTYFMKYEYKVLLTNQLNFENQHH